jgi:hypothetical protein
VTVKLEKISYSAIKDAECLLKFKLSWIDRLQRSPDNEFNIFGKCLHTVCEAQLFESREPSGITMEDWKKDFAKMFRRSLLELPTLRFSASELREFKEQGYNLIEQSLPEFDRFFQDKGKWRLVSIEEQLYEPIPEFELDKVNFKGFIDVVIEAGGVFYIMDLKSCGWGWDSRKKSDTLITYQLAYYKHFWSKKNYVPTKNIETYFVLLKRTAPKNNIEFVRVPVGDRKMRNAVEYAVKVLKNAYAGNFFKNKLACQYCPYAKTEYCP